MWQIAELPVGRRPFMEVEASPRRTRWTTQERRSGGEDAVHIRGGTKERYEARRDGRRPVICDSKRAIHLATCQDSIGGICLWNQSRRTSPCRSPTSLLVRFSDCLRRRGHDKTHRTEGREWKASDLSYRGQSVEGDYSDSWLVETDNTDKFRCLATTSALRTTRDVARLQ